ncbi:hypothetical protein [Vogesella indigofera]|uniref:hypothetical protein n=1 Tax=Vogesella indigofera TaxID=45465 RepID=UPI003F41C86F
MDMFIRLSTSVMMRVAVCALLAVSAQAGAADLDANMVLLRDVPDRPAIRPAAPSPQVVEVNISPARQVSEGTGLLSGSQLLSDDMLMANHGSKPAPVVPPGTGSPNHMSSSVVTPGQLPAPSASGSSQATGGIGGMINGSLAPITTILGR